MKQSIGSMSRIDGARNVIHHNLVDSVMETPGNRVALITFGSGRNFWGVPDSTTENLLNGFSDDKNVVKNMVNSKISSSNTKGRTFTQSAIYKLRMLLKKDKNEWSKKIRGFNNRRRPTQAYGIKFKKKMIPM